MSSHSYRTTTVVYYEYLTPDAYNCESIAWPIPAAISENYVNDPLGYFRYLSELQDQLAMSESQFEQPALIYELTSFQLLPFFELSEQRSQQEQECVHQAHQCVNAPNSDQVEAVTESENNYSNESVSKSISKPKTRNKNVYQAEQGYIVEEPTSESDEEPEGMS